MLALSHPQVGILYHNVPARLLHKRRQQKATDTQTASVGNMQDYRCSRSCQLLPYFVIQQIPICGNFWPIADTNQERCFDLSASSYCYGVYLLPQFNKQAEVSNNLLSNFDKSYALPEEADYIVCSCSAAATCVGIKLWAHTTPP